MTLEPNTYRFDHATGEKTHVENEERVEGKLRPEELAGIVNRAVSAISTGETLLFRREDSARGIYNEINAMEFDRHDEVMNVLEKTFLDDDELEKLCVLAEYSTPRGNVFYSGEKVQLSGQIVKESKHDYIRLTVSFDSRGKNAGKDISLIYDFTKHVLKPLQIERFDIALLKDFLRNYEPITDKMELLKDAQGHRLLTLVECILGMPSRPENSYVQLLPVVFEEEEYLVSCKTAEGSGFNITVSPVAKKREKPQSVSSFNFTVSNNRITSLNTTYAKVKKFLEEWEAKKAKTD